VTVARPHARLASRLLARLCRTGLVTRRVSMRGFTFCDDSPFPSFLAQGQEPLFGESGQEPLFDMLPPSPDALRRNNASPGHANARRRILQHWQLPPTAGSCTSNRAALSDSNRPVARSSGVSPRSSTSRLSASAFPGQNRPTIGDPSPSWQNHDHGPHATLREMNRRNG
jgi:hypothetical protein